MRVHVNPVLHWIEDGLFSVTVGLHGLKVAAVENASSHSVSAPDVISACSLSLRPYSPPVCRRSSPLFQDSCMLFSFCRRQLPEVSRDVSVRPLSSVPFLTSSMPFFTVFDGMPASMHTFLTPPWPDSIAHTAAKSLLCTSLHSRNSESHNSSISSSCTHRNGEWTKHSFVQKVIYRSAVHDDGTLHFQ